ncbi:hypothetical protein ABCR88_21745 [Pseudomonas sp. W17]|uniref:LuxR family transcriptional regulator n=1 Tax=Pseudomonas sp. W17 TaxID=3144407 RepID=A0AAU7WNZ0_9PSED
METLKVAIANDHPIVLGGYESWLSVANACALMEYLTRHFPNVLVLALTISSNPLSLTRLQEIVASRCAAVPSVLLTCC